MNIKIEKSRASGRVTAPPSKSYAHRLLIAAALAEGESVLENVAYSEDILATLDCLLALGAHVERNGDTVRVTGTGGKVNAATDLRCRESGSTLRFLIPVSLLGGGGAFLGTERLLERGVGVYREMLGERGISFCLEKGCVMARGQLASGHYRMRGDVSSQFVSGMLFALPLLEGDSTLEILPPFESREYVDMTVDALARFGVCIEKKGEFTYYIRGAQHYVPTRLAVEGDWSNAAFLLALNALGGDARVVGLEENSLQGDRVCRSLLERLENAGEVIDLSGCPDLAPVLMAVAAAKRGAHFVGTRRLAIKESDRAAAMAQELAKVGVAVDVAENSVTVHEGVLHTPIEAIDGHGDHRIVMAMSLLATLVGGEIRGAEAVGKSYPDFFEVLSSLGIEVRYEA